MSGLKKSSDSGPRGGSDESSAVLESFHPLIRRWFEENVGTPTDIQRQTWPAVAQGEHVLVSAPTGSGKTLTAFLWALNQMISGAWPTGQGIRALYISPLKALNNDINRNLSGPLVELRQVFEAAGEPFPNIRVMTRSGDTPANERSRMLRRPPDILITTPESLNILLTSRRGRTLFAQEDSGPADFEVDSEAASAGGPAASSAPEAGILRTLILDEIHAVAGGRRGTHLMTAVERLTEYCGEFQRIALSATVRPLERVAEFVGGYAVDDSRRAADPETGFEFRARPVRILETRAPKRIEIAVRAPGGFAVASRDAGEIGKTGVAPGDEQSPEPARREADANDSDDIEQSEEDAIWLALAREFTQIIARNRSTLFFTNSRRLAEKMTRLINQESEEALALCHHGSLSREIRLVVEERLKSGSLRAIVATSSLELGIDIGSVDEVVLIQTPRSVAQTLQRIGRAGHGVGQTSRGAIYPAHNRDILDAALMARAVDERAIEPVQPPRAPLDVIAQVIVSMVANQERDIEEVYARIRATHACHGLERRAFDLVLEMLAGRYADSRIRELRPRISIDRIRGRIRGRENVERVLYMSGGTIPDRGYFDLRVSESNAKIGSLDEEFVWERAIGEVFSLGNNHWKIVDITHNDVFVTPGDPAQDIAIVPFWRAELEDRGGHFCDRLRDFLKHANAALDREPDGTNATAILASEEGAAASAHSAESGQALFEELRAGYHLDAEPAARLVQWLRRQRHSTGVALPHRDHIVVEYFRDPASGGERLQTILHTFWGGRCNRPLALAFQAAWLEVHGESIQAIHNDDAVLLVLPHEVSAAALFAMLQSDRIEEYLRVTLEPGGFFGARFRENAGRALLLPPSGFGQRLPLWLNRLRSKKLLSAIRRYRDFPILLETWRGCFQESFEVDRLRGLIEDVQSGAIALGETRTRSASPFAADLVWRDTNVFMYADDSAPAGVRREGATTLDEQLLAQVVFSGERRPRIAEDLRREFQSKLQRAAPGYAPQASVEILEWVKDRVAIPLPEWQTLLESLEADLAADDPIGRDRVDGDPAAGDQDTVGASGESPVLETVLAELKQHLLVVVLPGAAIPVVIAAEILGRIADGLSGEDSGARVGEDAQASAEDPAPAAARDEGAASHTAVHEWVAQFLRYYGPVDPSILSVCFGFEFEPRERILRDLIETRRIVAAPLRKENDELCVCDAENLESLLRMARRRARPQTPARPLKELPAFLARVQGLRALGSVADADESAGVEKGEYAAQPDALETLRTSLERLMGYPAPPAAWEQEILPARVAPYYTSFLDTLFQENDLVWFHEPAPGDARLLETSPAKSVAPSGIAFAFAGDLELYGAGSGTAAFALDVVEPAPLDDEHARKYAATDSQAERAERQVVRELQGGPRSYSELYQHTGLEPELLTRSLWSLTRRGMISSDSFGAIRQGILSRFQSEARGRGASGGRGAFAGRSRGWTRGSRAGGRASGRWFLLDEQSLEANRLAEDSVTTAPVADRHAGQDEAGDLIAREEMIRERVRVLFARYGVLFRELLANEAPKLRWAEVFRQLRLMELSGEIQGGYFFEGVPGLQFLSPASKRAFARETDAASVYGMAAKDPASLAGIQSRNPEFRALGFPERKSGVHFAFGGDGALILISRRKFAALEIQPPPGDPRIAVALRYFARLLARDFQAPGHIRVETINGVAALKSEYCEDLIAFGFQRDFKYLTLRRAP